MRWSDDLSRARSPSTSLRRPIRRARWRTAPIFRASPRWRGASVSSSSPTNAIAKSIARRPPPGMLEAAGRDFANVVVFHSLSKRSSLPGLRVGLRRRRPQIPRDLSRTAQRRRAAGADADAARRHRRLWRRDPRRGEPPALSREIRSGRSDHRRPLRLPASGRRIFPLARRFGARRQRGGDAGLWREAGLRVVPGRYLAREQADGSNPGADYVRVAMVQNKEITAEALHRLVAVLG